MVSSGRRKKEKVANFKTYRRHRCVYVMYGIKTCGIPIQKLRVCVTLTQITLTSENPASLI